MLKAILVILLVLCVLLLILAFILMINIRITVGMKLEFYWKLTALGIPIKPEWIFRGKSNNKKENIINKLLDIIAGGKSDSSQSDDTTVAETTKNDSTKNVLTEISLLFGSVRSLVKIVPKGVRVRLRRLKIKVGGEDAADIALNYGKYHALLAGFLAFLGEYKGITYGFRANRRRISLSTDFLCAETTVDFEITVSFFLWQLIMMLLRFGIDYFMRILNS